MVGPRRPRIALKYLLLCLCLAAGVVAQEVKQDAEFKAALADAVEAQDFREEAQEEVKSKVVEEAPKAILASGTGDVSTTGDCAGDVDNFCAETKPGEGRISDCLSTQLEQENKGNVEGKKLTDACKKELDEFKIDRGTNINKNLPLAEACLKDSQTLCGDSDPTDPGAVLACLRDEKAQLSQACSDEIFKTQVEGAQDYRTDADLHLACEPDAKKICKDVKPGEGRIQNCLRDHVGQTSFECQEELFRQEVENADDIRLSHRLVKKCMSDKKKFCNDVKPGNARVKDCLEDHRNEAGFSAECKEEFELMMEARAADFRLDSSLRDKCADDIEDVCGLEKDSLDTVEGYDARVIECLQDYKDELLEPECKKEVHRLTERASQDIRFDEPLADACYDDRERLCEGVQAGSARVIRCLQEQREELSFECKATLFDAEVRMAEDIDFKFPMKRACSNELAQLCPGIQHGSARLIRCLQEHIEDSAMSSECKAEVESDMIRSNQDYRLNFRLTDKCEEDIEVLCGDACSLYTNQACGGRVLRCLTDKQDQVKSKECQNEIFYFEKMEVNDFRNDVLLAEACRADIDKYCKNVQPGEGRVHQCLRDKMDKLSEGCRQEELKLNIIQSRDIRLRPKLNKLCSEEIVVFCKAVEPGKGRVFKCLQENLAQPDFGSACKDEVEERGLNMQQNYQLDYGVSSACEPDVQAVCAEEKGKAHGHAEVLKCLVQNYKGLNDTCQTEMSRAVRMALWEYRRGMALTGTCDADVDHICQKAGNNPKNRGIWSIGAVGRCLSRQLAEHKTLTPGCQKLVVVAAPKDAQYMFDSSMTSAAIAQRIMEMQRQAGIKTQLINPYGRGASFITLSGWVALMALCSLFTVFAVSLVYAYRKWAGLDKEYTVSTKEGDV